MSWISNLVSLRVELTRAIAMLQGIWFRTFTNRRLYLAGVSPIQRSLEKVVTEHLDVLRSFEDISIEFEALESGSGSDLLSESYATARMYREQTRPRRRMVFAKARALYSAVNNRSDEFAKHVKLYACVVAMAAGRRLDAPEPFDGQEAYLGRTRTEDGWTLIEDMRRIRYEDDDSKPVENTGVFTATRAIRLYLDDVESMWEEANHQFAHLAISVGLPPETVPSTSVTSE